MARSITNLFKLEIAECPECFCKIPFYKSAQLGQILHCPECLEQLEVSWQSPPKLIRADHVSFDAYDEWAGDL